MRGHVRVDRFVDDHAEIRSTIDRKARILRLDRPQIGMTQAFGALAMEADVVVGPGTRPPRSEPCLRSSCDPRTRSLRHTRRRMLRSHGGSLSPSVRTRAAAWFHATTSHVAVLMIAGLVGIASRSRRRRGVTRPEALKRISGGRRRTSMNRCSRSASDSIRPTAMRSARPATARHPDPARAKCIRSE